MDDDEGGRLSLDGDVIRLDGVAVARIADHLPLGLLREVESCVVRNDFRHEDNRKSMIKYFDERLANSEKIAAKRVLAALQVRAGKVAKAGLVKVSELETFVIETYDKENCDGADENL